MILIDFTGVAMAYVFSASKTQISLEGLRHGILNALRTYNVKYRDKCGQLVVCCDNGSWRKQVYPEYKANRAKTRSESTIDWKEAFAILDEIKEDIIEHFPYPVIDIRQAEADDVIAVLAKSTQEFGQMENVMIISADKDFAQLQKYSNIAQYSPNTKKMIKIDDAHEYIFEHTIRGDSADGVPNMLSPDDIFLTEGSRQKSVSKKYIETVRENKDNLEEFLGEELWGNYVRNKIMIDFDCIPPVLAEKINAEYARTKDKNSGKVLPYLVSRRMGQLINCSNDFTTRIK